MSPIDQFEDIDAWKKARILTKKIYEITSTGEFSKDFGLQNQIQRASVSVMSNFAEGFERGGNQKFIQFLSQAKASCAEVRSQLYVAKDVGYLFSEAFDDLFELASDVFNLITGFINYLQESGQSDFRNRDA